MTSFIDLETDLYRQTSSPQRDNHRRPAPRSRSNTAHAYSERYTSHEEPPPMPEPEPVRPSIRSTGRVASSSRLDRHDEYADADSPVRPTYSRSSTFQGPTTIHRESTPVNGMRKALFPKILVRSGPNSALPTASTPMAVMCLAIHPTTRLEQR